MAIVQTRYIDIFVDLVCKLQLETLWVSGTLFVFQN